MTEAEIETIKKEIEIILGYHFDYDLGDNVVDSLTELFETKLNEIREEALKDFIEYYEREVIPEIVIEEIDFIPENVEYSCGVADNAFVKHIKEMIQTYLTTKEGKDD